MQAWLVRRPHAIFLLIALYFAVNVLVRVALPGALELDESEQIFNSQWLALGYGPQPPFYNWMLNGFFTLFGISLVTLSLFKAGLLFLAYLFYGLTARKLCETEEMAVIAVLGILTIPQVVFEAQRDLAHTVAVIFAACLFLYALVSTIRRPTALSYALTGLAIGIGMISKYNFALLPVAACLAMIVDPALRRHVLDRRIVLVALVAVLVILPHGVWVSENIGRATQSSINKMTEGGSGHGTLQVLEGILSLALAVAGFSALTLVVFFGIFGRRLLGIFKAGDMWTALFERIGLFGLAALVAVLVVVGGENIKDRWLVPLLVPLPLYLCLKAQAAGLDMQGALRRMVPVALAIMVIVPAALFSRVASSLITGEYKKLNIPYAALARDYLAPEHPCLIIAPDRHVAGNLHFQMLETPVQSAANPDFQPATACSAARPIMLVWLDKVSDPQAVPPALLEAARQRINLEEATMNIRSASVPYHYARGSDAQRFGYALIRPKLQ